MKQVSFRKFLVPELTLLLLLVSFEAGGAQRQFSLQDMINSCQQELQMFCTAPHESRNSVSCLRDNESRLITRDCMEEVRQFNRIYNHIRQPMEEPFEDDFNRIQ